METNSSSVSRSMGDAEGSLMRSGTMKIVYPVQLTPQEDNSVLVTFPDVPEALTDGATESEALTMAADCLVAALGGYIRLGRAIPEPSAPGETQSTVVLPLLVSAKLALYRSMRDAGLSCAEMAGRLRTEEKAVERLLDLDQRSYIERVDEALGILGKRLVVDVQDAA